MQKTVEKFRGLNYGSLLLDYVVICLIWQVLAWLVNDGLRYQLTLERILFLAAAFLLGRVLSTQDYRRDKPAKGAKTGGQLSRQASPWQLRAMAKDFVVYFVIFLILGFLLKDWLTAGKFDLLKIIYFTTFCWLEELFLARHRQ